MTATVINSKSKNLAEESKNPILNGCNSNSNFFLVSIISKIILHIIFFSHPPISLCIAKVAVYLLLSDETTTSTSFIASFTLFKKFSNPCSRAAAHRLSFYWCTRILLYLAWTSSTPYCSRIRPIQQNSTSYSYPSYLPLIFRPMTSHIHPRSPTMLAARQ